MDRGLALSVITTELKNLTAHYGLTSLQLFTVAELEPPLKHQLSACISPHSPCGFPAHFLSVDSSGKHSCHIVALTLTALFKLKVKCLICWCEEGECDNAQWRENFAPLKEECLEPFTGLVVKHQFWYGFAFVYRILDFSFELFL